MSNSWVAESGQRPLVSIIMSHLNNSPDGETSQFVVETLESVASQTYLDNTGGAELIIFDDGSPPHQLRSLREIVAELQQRHKGRFVNFSGVHSVVPNMGKNTVLEFAKSHIDRDRSRYTVVIDRDDVYRPNFLEALFLHLEGQRKINPDMVMAYSDNILITKEGYICGIGCALPFDRDEYYGVNGQPGKNHIPGPSLVLTKRFLAGFPKDFYNDRDKHKRHIGELGDRKKDKYAATHFGYQNTSAGMLYEQGDQLFFYRQHQDQMTGSMAQLHNDTRYGPEGFFASVPLDFPKMHWRDFEALSRAQQIELLDKIPRADHQHWEHYRPAPRVQA